MLMEKEMISSNMSSSFMFRPVRSVIEESLNQQNLDYQELLSLFEQNYNGHTDSYNKEFKSVMYQDACLSISEVEDEEIIIACEFIQNWMQAKGLYPTVVNYWQDMANVHEDYIGSSRTKKVIG